MGNVILLALAASPKGVTWGFALITAIILAMLIVSYRAFNGGFARRKKPSQKSENPK